MLIAFLATRAGKFAAGGLAIVLLIVGFMFWLHGREKAAVEADRAKVAAKVLETSRRADAAAQATTAAIQSKVETTNEQARDAARNSDDPLRDGFGKLRSGKASPSPATR